MKNEVIAKRQGKMKYLSDIYEGKRHDIAIADQENTNFQQGVDYDKIRAFKVLHPVE